MRARASAFVDYIRQLPYNCAAIRDLKRNGMLPAEEFSKLIDYARINESAANYFWISSRDGFSRPTAGGQVALVAG